MAIRIREIDHVVIRVADVDRPEIPVGYADIHGPGSTQHGAEIAAAEDVDMEVGYFLIGVPPVVRDQPIAVGVDPHQTGDIAYRF